MMNPLDRRRRLGLLLTVALVGLTIAATASSALACERTNVALIAADQPTVPDVPDVGAIIPGTSTALSPNLADDGVGIEADILITAEERTAGALPTYHLGKLSATNQHLLDRGALATRTSPNPVSTTHRSAIRDDDLLFVLMCTARAVKNPSPRLPGLRV